MRCPGQDRRYWTPDIIYEVPCPECGAPVECFKDEPRRRCPKCGHRFRNVGADLGCAQWCTLAEQCLGFTPERRTTPKSKEGALAGRLIQWLGDQLKDQPARMAIALKTFHHARELVVHEGGDPRVVIAAALLLDISENLPPEAVAGTDRWKKSKQILTQAGADQETTERVCDILDGLQSGTELDRAEWKVVRDAQRLARLTTEPSAGPSNTVDEVIDSQLITESAKKKARSWAQSVASQAEGAGSEQHE